MDEVFDRFRQLHLEHHQGQHDAGRHVEQASAQSPRFPPVEEEYGGEGDCGQHQRSDDFQPDQDRWREAGPG